MSQIQEMNDQPEVPKRIYVFVGISLLFAFLTFVAGLALFTAFLDFRFQKYLGYLCFSPFILCFAGILFGLIAKETARSHLTVSFQGFLAEISIYLNLTSIGLLMLAYVLYIIYLAPLSD